MDLKKSITMTRKSQINEQTLQFDIATFSSLLIDTKTGQQVELTASIEDFQFARNELAKRSRVGEAVERIIERDPKTREICRVIERKL